MQISDCVVGKPSLVPSESCEIKHWSYTKRELSLIPVLLEEGCLWITMRSGLMGTLSSFHQRVGIPASL